MYLLEKRNWSSPYEVRIILIFPSEAIDTQIQIRLNLLVRGDILTLNLISVLL